ncbi:MAG: hypothetical protein HKN87_07840 [Saprospiraceae bacterium]|nr:hypothetical protein [Saprospiraceae bacterium]
MKTVYALCVYLACLDASFLAQNTISPQGDRKVSHQTAIATFNDGSVQEVYVQFFYSQQDSLVVFSGAGTNVFQLSAGNNGDERIPFDPGKFKSLVFAERVFESHAIKIPGVERGLMYFFEKFYSTPVLELFEFHSNYHNNPIVTFFVKLIDSPFLFRLVSHGDDITFMPLVVTTLDHIDGMEFRNRAHGTRDDLVNYAERISNDELDLLSAY